MDTGRQLGVQLRGDHITFKTRKSPFRSRMTVALTRDIDTGPAVGTLG